MKIGIKIGLNSGPETTVDNLVSIAQQAEAKGFDSVWMPNIFGLDALSMLGIIGNVTKRLDLGTAVTPTYPRHPVAMAQQALTTQAASHGRLLLGIGLSHKLVVEDMFGLSYDKPAAHMEEYLQVLQALLSGEQVSHQGEQFRVNAAFNIQGASKPPVIVAALGPRMLKIAGRLAEGTITWMTGVQTLASHIVPAITAAASEAGRPAPRVIAGLPVVLTDKAGEVRAKIAEQLALYGQLPSYKAMLEKEGATTPADIALVGNEAELRAQIQTLRDAGVTDLNAAVMAFEDGQFERTVGFLATELAQ
ncbi:MAG: 5,10-methylenetetrahydromethanopterin reductase [Paracoccaceae bacterium]|jgi:5,10-methylenetetrahydromethanopterin reductase